MCPACGSPDVSILVALPRPETVRMTAAEQKTVTGVAG